MNIIIEFINKYDQFVYAPYDASIGIVIMLLRLLKAFDRFKDNIKSLEDDRQKLYNQIRREKNPDAAEVLKKQCRDISASLKPIRKELKIAQRIEENLPKVRELLSKEEEMEKEILKQRNREYER